MAGIVRKTGRERERVNESTNGRTKSEDDYIVRYIDAVQLKYRDTVKQSERERGARYVRFHADVGVS